MKLKRDSPSSAGPGHRPWPIDAFWRTDVKYSHTGDVTFCKNCGDTAFELLDNKKPTGKCCRCGESFN